MSDENIFTQHNVKNKQLKQENENLRKEENEKLRKEHEKLRKNNVVKDAEIKESIEKPKEIKSPEEDKNTTHSYPNWFDKNKFKNILAIIDSNKFNYRHKIGEFKYIGIKDLVNNIKNNTISEISAKKDLNTLNKIKNAEIIKYKKRTPGHKELLNLFNDLLDIILTDKTLESESQEDKNENENDKTLMSSKDENKNAKNKKNSTNTKKDENENMLLEYMEDVDDKLFKEYSNGKNFNSFINEFDHATNEEDKEKVVKELKDINNFVNHEIFIRNEDSEYRSKLIGIVNAIDYFLDEYSKNEQVILIRENSQKLLSTLWNLEKFIFFLVYV